MDPTMDTKDAMICSAGASYETVGKLELLRL
jgi:hypothetical protein